MGNDVSEWSQQAFRPQLRSPFYAFAPSREENLCMTSVGISSADWDVLVSDADNSEWIFPERQVGRILVDLFKEVPQVKSICAQFGSEGITVWTLLESFDRQAREKVYEKELKICQDLRIFDFDFRATSIDLVSPEELVRNGLIEIFKRS